MLTIEDVDDIRDWWDGEREGDSAGSMLGRLDATVAVIVRRHVTAALTDAADAIETADYCDCRDAYCGKPRRSVAGTASIVRAQIPPPP